MAFTKFINRKEPKKNIGIVFSCEYGGYVKNYSNKQIGYRFLNKQDAIKCEAGYEADFFPEFDPEKHFVDVRMPHHYETERCKATLYDAITVEPEKLPFGAYTIKIVNGTVTIIPLAINMDKYIDFNQNVGAKYFEEFTKFRKAKDIYKNEGQAHRRGNFTFGPPGCGKSMEIQKLLSKAKDDKFYGFVLGARMSLDVLLDLRDVLDAEDKVVVLEEVTERLKAHPPEELLSFTDGETSWNHCYTIATTNYPEKLAPNIVDRPRRFSTICHVDYPNREQKAKFMAHKGVSEEDIEVILNLIGEKISIDYVREVLLIAKLEQKSYKDVIIDIKKNRKLISKSFRGTIGLSNSSDGDQPKLIEAACN